MYALRLPYIPLLGPFLGSGNADQILCLLKIFVPVVKLCLFECLAIHLFLSFPPTDCPRSL